MSKYILVTSGVCSSLGKGVATASIGSLLESSGLKIAIMKCDPYINIDAGTISPYQHGEVYVTEDGAETDSDLGNYSRFTSVHLSNENLVTIGKVYKTVIENERAGRYNGRTVQVIPHITDEIKRRIVATGSRTGADVVIVEIGGTVGDIESIPFLEVARQLSHEMGKHNCITVHLTLVPTIIGGELKTKPTQQSVKKLQEMGIQPDILLCRCDRMIDDDMKRKIAMFCNVGVGSVFTSTDFDRTIYELPVIFHTQGLEKKVFDKLGLEGRTANVDSWLSFKEKLDKAERKVTIAMVGKKDYLDDCFKSVRESIFHAAVTNFGADVEIKKIDAESLEETKDIAPIFAGVDAIVIPGNYGQRGFLGLLQTVKYARENNVPFLGIDLGMQLMAIETARSLLQWKDADSTEFMQNATHAIISLPEEQSGVSASGIMKLGSSKVRICEGSRLHGIFGSTETNERHRSKYTFDKKYAADMESKGLSISAYSDEDGQTEAFEWKDHPWGIGVQFHPEFISRPMTPHPLFTAFVGAALKAAEEK
ncbi:MULTISPECIES: CTP synthase [Treponema]|uniref:CTP synthase (glutamine hydrolyzing) n=1 Tax=Treponema saccharophilum DSM 2985 TaxID=907348 RepID=H7EHL7_9SPIR|nr:MULTISPECIES: CTP synthase [Treponema]EIC02963.1 CTP synthase [Treponema saccharophilum DSM 2985]MBQ5538475.1 CTP synthase [Treponema sp.]BDC95451.1 CTP synthase [Treponema saccharophilum]